MCDECDSVWLDPERITEEYVLYTAPPDFSIPGLQCSIQSPPARWASREEIIRKGWGSYIFREGNTFAQ